MTRSGGGGKQLLVRRSSGRLLGRQLFGWGGKSEGKHLPFATVS